MHKGYTIPYFIRFFQEIPASRWHCGALTNAPELNDGKCAMKACALGYAGAYSIREEKDHETGDVTYYEGEATTPAREEALNAIFDEYEGQQLIASINDAKRVQQDRFAKLGKTPRARVLKALRLRQKFGKNWHEKL